MKCRKPSLVALLWLSLSGGLTAATLQPASLEQFCLTPGRRTVLRWHVEPDSIKAPVDVILRDYANRVVPLANAPALTENSLELTVELSPGFYEIELPATEQRFGLLCHPAFEGQRDAFFAIDSAMSWLVHDDATREGLVKTLARCGIPMSRERLNWSDINPKADQWNWDTSRQYETLRQVCRREGVEVLEMFHGTTGWAGHVGKYPDDLVGMARAWQQIAGRYGPTWAALEVWNEPDISFGDYLPADQYVPLVKTFAYTFGEASISTPLVGGVFAHFQRQYLDNVARNGLLDQVPVVSFHTYDRAPAMETLIGRYRQWLIEHGHPSKPLWLTECGRPWRRGPERPPAEQDAESALDIVMKGVESKACGIARYFPFVYPYYEERESNFGMMGREATPLRSMAAYVQLVSALSHKQYLGDLVCEDAKIQRARVFDGANETVAVLYTAKPDAQATVQIGLGVQAIAGIDGRPLKISEDGSVPVPDGLAYVRLDKSRLGDRLRTDTTAMDLLKSSREAAVKVQPPSPIVLRYQLDPQRVAAKSEGYRLQDDAPEKVPFVFRAFNLASEPQMQSLTLSFSQPVDFESDATRQVTIPAAGYVDVRWEVGLKEAFAATGSVRATVRASDPEGKFGDLVEIDLEGNPTLEQVLRRFPVRQALPIDNLSAWRPAIAETGKMTMERPDDGGWRLKCQFQGGDRWVYPQFQLGENVKLEDYSAIVLRARCEHEAAVRVFLWEGDTGVGYLSPVVVPADGKWHTAVVLFDDFHLSGANRPDANLRLDRDQVGRISIGMNSEADENSLEVSDALFVTGAK